MKHKARMVFLLLLSLVIWNNLDKPVLAQVISGRCGDGVCDEFEKGRRDLCPQDCPFEEFTGQPEPREPAKEQEVLPITANIIVDYSQDLGVFSPYLFGIQGLKLSASDTNVRESGFKLIATHAPAFSPLSVNGYDLNKLSDMDADIKEIVKIKATPMLYFYQIVNPIRSDGDAKRYGSSVQAIARHLRDNWPDQEFVFFFGNEPDWEIMRCAGEPAVPAGFWDGSRQDFFKAYSVWAKAIKSVDAGFIVGGAGVAIPVLPMNIKDRDCEINTDFTGIPGEVSRWVTDFLDYAKSNKVPVDFFSFHAYSKLLRVRFYDEVGKLAAKLKEYPNLSPLFGAPLLATNEWNMMLTDDVGARNLCFHGEWDDNCVKQLESFKTSYKSAHNIAALINMIDQGLQLNTAYAALYQNVPSKSIERTKSDDTESSCRFFTLVCSNETRNIYYAFKGFNRLADTIRLAVSGADHANLAAIAGKDKTDKSVLVVLANYDYNSYSGDYPAPNALRMQEDMEYSQYKKSYGRLKVYNQYTLTLDNLPWVPSDKVIYERYIVDENKRLELTETKTMPGGNTLTFTKDIFAPSVEVVKVYVK